MSDIAYAQCTGESRHIRQITQRDTCQTSMNSVRPLCHQTSANATFPHCSLLLAAPLITRAFRQSFLPRAALPSSYPLDIHLTVAYRTSR